MTRPLRLCVQRERVVQIYLRKFFVHWLLKDPGMTLLVPMYPNVNRHDQQSFSLLLSFIMQRLESSRHVAMCKITELRDLEEVSPATWRETLYLAHRLVDAPGAKRVVGTPKNGDLR